jgi:hypothetical protein
VQEAVEMPLQSVITVALKGKRDSLEKGDEKDWEKKRKTETEETRQVSGPW